MEDRVCKGPYHDGKPVYLFEVSHEVAKKSGGIYTVISSKARITVDEWQDHYVLLGIYNPSTAAIEFEPITPTGLSEALITTLRAKYGITAYYGRWLVKGCPHAFLFDINTSVSHLPEWRDDLQHGFCLENDAEANNAILFGYQIALFFKEFHEMCAGKCYAIAHFHEWLASVGLIVMRKWKIPIPTLFTTHATLLGRYLCAGGMDLMKELKSPALDIDYQAGFRGIYNRHWIEVGAAKGATVFTTVSEITGTEATRLLDRAPECITPNGLNTEHFVAMHEFQNLHKKYRDVIAEFCRGHFFGAYDFDLDNTLFFFTAGRREYLNKGVDLMIDALAELNYLLKRDGSKMTVVAFIIMPGTTNNLNVESIKGQSSLRLIRETCDALSHEISDTLYEDILRGEFPDFDSIIKPEELVLLKRRLQLVVKSSRLPPIVTHNVVNDADDEILNHLRRVKLFNMPDDRVKVVYHPEFLSATSPILPLDYADFVRGCHLGIFCSYYEPWGYTPAECALSGIPSVSSNLTGFASYMSKRLANPEEHGIYIVDRIDKGYEDSKSQLAECLHRFCQQDRRQRVMQRNKTEKLSGILSWDAMYKHYIDARNMALKEHYGFELPKPDFLVPEVDLN